MKNSELPKLSVIHKFFFGMTLQKLNHPLILTNLAHDKSPGSGGSDGGQRQGQMKVTLEVGSGKP